MEKLSEDLQGTPLNSWCHRKNLEQVLEQTRITLSDSMITASYAGQGNNGSNLVNRKPHLESFQGLSLVSRM